MFLDEDSTITTVPLKLPEVGPVVRLMRRLVPWMNPYNTVAIVIVIDERLMRIYREREVNEVDWDIAEGLMHLVAHPSQFKRAPSIVRHVSEWEIRQVEDAKAALTKAIESP